MKRRDNGTDRPYKLGQSKRRICSGIKASSPHTERRDPDKWAGIESSRNENGRSGSVFAGSAPWLSWSVYRNEIREREDHKSTRRVYGASSGAGLQNGGGIRSRTGPRSDPALSGPREGFDLVNCEEAVKMFGRCEGVPAAWAPCQKCEFFKERKKGE